MSEIILKVREMLVDILCVDDISEIGENDSLVNDLGADSIDFVEMIYSIEQNFGITIKPNEIVSGGVNAGDLFDEDILTEEGASIIGKNLPDGDKRFSAGMSRMELFSQITVSDLTQIIKFKMGQ